MVALGQLVTRSVARFPKAWVLLRRPMRAFFDGAAASWDEDVRPHDPEHLAALGAALDLLPSPPKRILDVGTGTGAAAVALARRYPDARVEAIDVSERMIEAAREALPDDVAGRIALSAQDIAHPRYDPASFDLVTHVSVPVFFAEVARLLEPAGHVVVAASLGRSTPCFTPHRLLVRGFERHGVEKVESGEAGTGTFWLGRKR